MKRLRQLPNGPAEDRGAALILVLIIVTVIGLSGAALLTFSDTSIRTTVALRDQAGNAYNADGAAQIALDNLRTGYGFESSALFTNDTNTTCFGPDDASGTRNLEDFYPAANGQNGSMPSSASVVCTADPATGINDTVPITSDNRPGQAILTLGQTSQDGINIKALGKPGDFAVKGAVSSNSNINVDHGTLQSTAAVTAFGGCSGSIVSTPSALCDTKKSLDDPDYPAGATEVPEYKAVPASCSGGVVKFDPGYYDDAMSLTALMAGNGPCGGSTWWFTPGTYYFDFHNVENPELYEGPAKSKGANTDEWSIGSGHLVAGTPTDSDGKILDSPGSSPTLPGSCQSPIKSITAKGVQFIFGGDSRLVLEGSADAEICGTYSTKRPPIAIYGVKSGNATTPTTLTGPGSGAGSGLKMSTVASLGKFKDPTGVGVRDEDAKSATWAPATATAKAPETSEITVSGYAPPTAIPAGSIVKSATVRVTHGNSSTYTKYGPSKDVLALTFTPTGGKPIPLSPKLNAGKGLNTDSFDIYGGGTSDFVKDVHDHGFTGAEMAFKATLFHSGIESLDAMQLDITYVTPAFRKQDTEDISDNCMTPPYGSKGSCAVLSTHESYKGAFYVQGTTYTPKAAIDLTLNNATQQVMRFGVISRSFWIKQNPSFSYPGPVIEVPDDTAGGNGSPVVFLTVYICPATTTDNCSAHSAKIAALRVKALIDDSTSTRRMKILSWSVQR